MPCRFPNIDVEKQKEYHSSSTDSHDSEVSPNFLTVIERSRIENDSYLLAFINNDNIRYIFITWLELYVNNYI